MNLRDRLDQITSLEATALTNLPWEVRRLFPQLRVSGDQISFSENGDYVTAAQALEGLNLLIKELTPTQKPDNSSLTEKLKTFVETEDGQLIEKLHKSEKKTHKKGKK